MSRANYHRSDIAEPDDRHKLDGGAWRLDPFKHIQVWVPGTTNEPEPEPEPELSCGDKRGLMSGYHRHKRRGEPACIDCLNATRDYARKRRGITEIADPLPHGTHAAYCRHINNGVTPCEPCADAERTYQREARRRHRARKKSQETAA